MRAYQVFGGMPPERAAEVLRSIAEAAPGVFREALGAACSALRLRPVYLNRQPFERRARAVQRTVSRVAADALAEELLAAYFLECRKPLLVEWLDEVGLEHDEGTLKSDDPPQPEPGALRAAVERFRKPEDGADRELLLHAFAAQSVVHWPELDALLGPTRASG